MRSAPNAKRLPACALLVQMGKKRVIINCLLWVHALGGGLGPLYNMQEVSGSSGDSSDSRSGSDAGARPGMRAGCMGRARS